MDMCIRPRSAGVGFASAMKDERDFPIHRAA